MNADSIEGFDVPCYYRSERSLAIDAPAQEDLQR
jgi:hypothetical protein